MLNSSGSPPPGGAVALGEVAVAGEGAHHHDRAGREGDVAEGDLLDEDAGGEGGDRLEAQRLLHRLRRQLGPFPQQLPLVGVFSEQPDRVRELALGGVHAADQDVQHEVHALHVREPLALLFGGDQQRDQVLAGLLAARAHEAPGVLVELRHRLFDRRFLLGHRDRVELALDPVRPVVQPRGVLQRRAHHVRNRLRGVGLGDVAHELAGELSRVFPLQPWWADHAGLRGHPGAPRPHPLEDPLQQLAHHRAVALDRARGERGVDEAAQAGVVGAVDVEDVAAHLLVQRPLAHVEDLRDRHSGEDRRARAQEELDRLTVEHRVAVRPRRQPPAGRSKAASSSRIVVWKRSPRSVGSV